MNNCFTFWSFLSYSLYLNYLGFHQFIYLFADLSPGDTGLRSATTAGVASHKYPWVQQGYTQKIIATKEKKLDSIGSFEDLQACHLTIHPFS